jgi:WD40-like Beta Propeller Repeat
MLLQMCLVGCYQPPSSPNNELTDAPSAVLRINLPFTNPASLRLTGADPSLAFDETELWSVGSATPFDLQVAKSEGVPPSWTNDPMAVMRLNIGPASEVEPALTKDGLLLAFASDRSGGAYKLFLATRIAKNLPFNTPSQTNLAFPRTFQGFDMSPDGLKLYIVDNGMLRVMKRASLTGEFVFDKMINLPVTDFSYPSVSFDELEIVYSDKNTATVMHATLNADKNSYELPTVLAVGETCSLLEDADLSADAMTVVYNCNGSIHIARR